MFFSSNIRILRNRRKRTQDIVAGELSMSRSTLNSYENGSIKNPTLDALMIFSKYFRLGLRRYRSAWAVGTRRRRRQHARCRAALRHGRPHRI